MKVSLKKVVPTAAPAATVPQQPTPVAAPVQPTVIVAPTPVTIPQVQVANPTPIVAPVPATPAVDAQYAAFLEFQKNQAAAAAAATPQPVPAPAPAVPTVPVQVVVDPTPSAQDLAAAGVPTPTAAVSVIETPEDAAESRALVEKNFFGKSAGMQGDWDQSNIILPRLQIVQGNGELSKRFPSGTVLLADDEFLPPSNAKSPAIPVRFVPIQLRKQFREKVDQNSGLKPRIAYSKEEVLALGGQFAWVNGVRPNWDETARGVMLLELPQGIDHPAFSEVDGLTGKYAVVVYYASGVSFKSFGEVLATAAASTLRVPTGEAGQSQPYLPKRWWTATVEPRPWGKFNPYAVCAKQKTEETSEAIRAYCNGFLNASVADE